MAIKIKAVLQAFVYQKHWEIQWNETSAYGLESEHDNKN